MSIHKYLLTRLHPGANALVLCLAWPAASTLAAETTPAIGLLTESEFFGDITPIAAVTRLPQPKSETPAAVTIIDRDMILASGARHFADIFRLIPGFQVAYYQLDIPVVTYHGLADLNSRRMLVLIDGRSAYGAFSGNVNWESLNVTLDEVERIEVIRGPNTVTYGDNAFLATVNIITQHASQTQGVSSQLTAGNHDIGDAQFRYGTQFDGGAIRFTAAYQGEYGEQRTVDDFNSRFANVRADLQPSAHDNILLTAGYGKTDTALGIVGSTFFPPTDQLKKTRSEQIAWQHAYSEDNNINLQLYHNYGKHNRDYVTGPFNAGIYGIIQLPINVDAIEERYDVELQHTSHPFEPLRLVWGIGAREDSTQSVAFFNTTDIFKNRSSRFFGSAEWRATSAMIFNAGGMWEKNDLTGSDFSPRLAVNYHINNQHTVHATWSKANRIPSLVEEYADQRITYAGLVVDQHTLNQSGIVVETMNSYELGYQGRFPDANLTLDMRLYRDRIKNFIADTSIAATDVIDHRALQNANVGDITVDGLDIELSYRPDRDTRIVLTNALMKATAIVNNSASVYSAEQLTQTVPKYSGSLFAMHRLTPDWQISLGYYWVDDMRWLNRVLNSNYAPVNTYTRLDLRLARRLRIGNARGELALVMQNAGSDYQDFSTDKIFSTLTFATFKLEL